MSAPQPRDQQPRDQQPRRQRPRHERPRHQRRWATSRRLLAPARRVALGATVVVFVVYLLAGAVADVVVVRHASEAVDARLADRLAELASVSGRAAIVPSAGPIRPLSALGHRVDGDGDGDDDIDEAPVFGWWLAAGARHPVAADLGAPALPLADAGHRGVVVVDLGGRPFRLLAQSSAGGTIVAATSEQQIDSLRTTLLVTEAALLPFVLGTFFAVAYVIGRRSALPVERARQRQLEFTADASHELRTPLSVIEAEVGLALSVERDAADYRIALGRVATESRRLRSIVEDLLWLARLDALPAPAHREPVDLAVIAESCVERFAAVARQRGIMLRTAADGEGAVVSAPAEWLDRLASVLVDNACRYCTSGGSVVVGVQVHDGRPALLVDDSGPGIAEHERERIFQRFHRASFSTAGAGLGLAIADTVVRATGGSWEVGSSPEGGARFVVSWPKSAGPTGSGSRHAQPVGADARSYPAIGAAGPPAGAG